jgi:hypothetical protein
LLIFSTRSKVLAVRAEANATNVEIAVLVDRLILKGGYILAGSDIKNLSRSITASGDVFAIATESDAANNTVVNQVVDELNVQYSLHFGVEDCVPIGTFPFLGGRKIIWVPVGERVAWTFTDKLSCGCRARDLRRSARGGVVELMSLLRSGRSWWSSATAFSGSWRRSGWRRRSISCRTKTESVRPNTTSSVTKDAPLTPAPGWYPP